MNCYDFDKTIYNGDSTKDFYLFCLKRHKGIIKTFPGLIKAFTKFYVLKKGNKTDFKETRRIQSIGGTLPERTSGGKTEIP